MPSNVSFLKGFRPETFEGPWRSLSLLLKNEEANKNFKQEIIFLAAANQSLPGLREVSVYSRNFGAENSFVSSIEIYPAKHGERLTFQGFSFQKDSS